MKDGVIVLASGETRYLSGYVKQSGKPFKGKKNTHNGFVENEGFISWTNCNYYGVTVPTVDEEPVQFVFISAAGANYYYGLYDRREEMKPILEEKAAAKRRSSAIRNYNMYEDMKKLGTWEDNHFDWKPYWKECVQLVKVQVVGTEEEVEKMDLFGLKEMRKHYDIYSVTDTENEASGEFARTYQVATKMVIVMSRTTVSGTRYEGRGQSISRMNKDTQIYLAREPENTYDSNAVAVYAMLEDSNEKIGFLSRDYAQTVSPLLEENKKVYLELLDIKKEHMGEEGPYGSFEEWEQYIVRIRIGWEEESFYVFDS